MNLDSSNNIVEVTKKYMSQIWGYTTLDILVVSLIPFINLISNTFYLKSFKKTDKNISKICLQLTDLNQELHELLNPILPTKKNAKIIKSYQ